MGAFAVVLAHFSSRDASPHIRPLTTRANDTTPPSLALFLAMRGEISAQDMMRLSALAQRQEAPVSDILIGLGMMDEARLAQLQAQRLGEKFYDLSWDPPSPAQISRFGAQRVLQTGVMPWRQRGGRTIILTHSPELFDRHRDELEHVFGPIKRGFASRQDIVNTITNQSHQQLTHMAETRVPPAQSCRSLHLNGIRTVIAGGILALALAWVMVPQITFVIFAGWAVLTLILNTFLKLTAALIYAFSNKKTDTTPDNTTILARLPTVSIMVPLFKETEIASQLVARLKRINYPKELLDILLVVEADDTTTAATLAGTQLPVWIKTITVPMGSLKTKPRALNFALDHCRGSIIGVYDAEDATHPFQIKHIVRRFSQRGPEVACLQGVLDFYNPRTNWLSRCFTIEYATWFRIILPGLEKLGLPVPLGGTTLFFRRHVLEQLGGWDAHNVTEDADLGIRLARYGYKTELIQTVTLEEANCRPWPWVRQRSRWLKGYAMTWAVHMRAPRALWRDLGAWKFFGVQLLFAGTLSQFILAPLLWTFWFLLFDLPHPLNGFGMPNLILGVGVLFLISELITISVGMLSVAQKDKRHLLKWVPSLHFYFPLGCLAAYKGLAEILYQPFYWDKTSHGVVGEDPDDPGPNQPNRGSGGLQKLR